MSNEKSEFRIGTDVPETVGQEIDKVSHAEEKEITKGKKALLATVLTVSLAVSSMLATMPANAETELSKPKKQAEKPEAPLGDKEKAKLEYEELKKLYENTGNKFDNLVKDRKEAGEMKVEEGYFEEVDENIANIGLDVEKMDRSFAEINKKRKEIQEGEAALEKEEASLDALFQEIESEVGLSPEAEKRMLDFLRKETAKSEASIAKSEVKIAENNKKIAESEANIKATREERKATIEERKEIRKKINVLNERRFDGIQKMMDEAMNKVREINKSTEL